MLFNSYDFLWFLPLALGTYWLARRRLWLQNVVTVVASYVFYAWWDARFLGLIVAVTLVGYLAGVAMGLTERRPLRRLACGACAAGCLTVLGAFKYHDFFAAEFSAMMGAWGMEVSIPLWNVALPVGISFYTFQVLGYAVDVYRRRCPACRDAVAFAAFVSFFPQLVAGPIERATSLLPQMRRRRRWDYALAADGARLMLWGFVKKMLLADRCAAAVDAIYADPLADGTDLCAAAVLFAFQIYGDFSGYSDIAVGTARLFGIRLSRNFALPYFARSVPEFWRRWHITLMTWFKDYVYIPLGGSRRGRARRARNLLVVFLLSGLWHGAAWTFVFWGLFQLAGYVPSLLRRPGSEHAAQTTPRRLLPTAGEAVRMLATFAFVCIGWVFFRAEDLPTAFGRLALILTDFCLHKPQCGWMVFCPVVLVLAAEWLTRGRAHALDFRGHGLLRFRAARWAVYYALILAVLYWGGQQTAFIYFQF